MVSMDTLVSLCKRRGFVFQSSEIYGGTGSCWDYGPLGVELKSNIKRVWWRDFVQRRPDMVGIDASILMHPTVWKASGHLENFTDPMVDCRECKLRFRADQVDALPWTHFCPATKGNKFTIPPGEPCGHCAARRTLCPDCGKGELTPPRQFNLMFKTFMGPVEEDAGVTYLRPETAQAMFVNFENVLQSMRLKLPFGIAQAGRSFRNEITPGNFIFRSREFEQMEIEYFVNPHDRVEGRPADEYWHDRWIADCLAWFRRYGLRDENLRLREHDRDELSHYSKRTVDIEYAFPFTDWGELEGIANRTDFDLKAHEKLSGQDLTYYDQERDVRYHPYVIEPAAGADRATLAFLVDAYSVDEAPTAKGTMEKRTVLRLHRDLAPTKVAVLPLSRHEDLVPEAKRVFDVVKPHWMTDYDDAGAIGRRYRRQDEVGTPYCVTVDFDTLQDRAVTVRDRDSMAQERIEIVKLLDHLRERLDGAPA